MLNTQNTLQEKNDPQTTTAQKPPRIYIHDYPAKDIKNAILPLHSGNCPVEELIAVGEAVFEFINGSDMELRLKNAFGHLERLFDFYKNLIESGNNRIILVRRD